MERYRDIFKAWATNSTVIGVTAFFQQTEAWLRLVLLFLTIVYTLKKIFSKGKPVDDSEI